MDAFEAVLMCPDSLVKAQSSSFGHWGVEEVPGCGTWGQVVRWNSRSYEGVSNLNARFSVRFFGRLCSVGHENAGDAPPQELSPAGDRGWHQVAVPATSEPRCCLAGTIPALGWGQPCPGDSPALPCPGDNFPRPRAPAGTRTPGHPWQRPGPARTRHRGTMAGDPALQENAWQGKPPHPEGV